MFFKKIFFSFILFFPSVSFGQIIFSEIMFDAEGTDAGYEWVEIKNTENFSVNLENYKFCEGAPTCHSWASGKNLNFDIPANSLAIITDDREKFLEKNSFDGLVLVSTGFTLNNTGELIQIKNSSGNLDDSLTYNPESGGQNGETLSVFSNIWKKSVSTPGKENVEKIEKSINDKEEENLNTSYSEISSDTYFGKKKLKAEINEIGVVMAGAKIKISGKAFGISGVEISGIDFFWNLGDGKKDYGQEIFHEFIFSGEYIISLVVKSGNFTGEDKIKIKVVKANIEISDVRETKNNLEGFIKIKNNSLEILNLSGWLISVDGEDFKIPEKTFIDKNSEIIFPNRITDLIPENNANKKSRIFLKFPSGQKFFSYSFDKKEVAIKIPVEKKSEEKIKIVEKIIYVEKKNTKKEEQKIPKKFSVVKKNEIENDKEIIFDSEKYFIKKYSLKSSEDFVKDQWPLLTFIFFLGSLIILVLYIKKNEENFSEENEDFISENHLKKTEKENYEKEIKSEADKYEIEEILEK